MHRILTNSCLCLVCFCPVVGGFQPQDQVMPSAGGHEEPSPGAGFGQPGQSFYNSRAVPRTGPRNARGMMNGYRGSTNGFRGTSMELCFTEMQKSCGFVIHCNDTIHAYINFNVFYHQGDMKAIALLSQMLPVVVMAKPNLTRLGTIPITPTSGYEFISLT